MRYGEDIVETSTIFGIFHVATTHCRSRLVFGHNCLCHVPFLGVGGGWSVLGGVGLDYSANCNAYSLFPQLFRFDVRMFDSTAELGVNSCGTKCTLGVRVCVCDVANELCNLRETSCVLRVSECARTVLYGGVG